MYLVCFRWVSWALWEEHHHDAIHSSRNLHLFRNLLYECLDVNLRITQRIQKEFDESNGDYEGTAARMPRSDRSDLKRTPEFVGEIQNVVDNDSSKLIRSISYQTGSA